MTPPKIATRTLPTRVVPTVRPATNVWSVVLAGGEGVRLRTLVRRVYGEERPKQYAALIGARSLLRLTLDRLAPVIAPERTVVVTLRSHARYIAEEFTGPHTPRVLVQPDDRGTAAGILLPAHWIETQDPEAVVAVFPSDHFVLQEEAFMEHVSEVAAFVARCAEWIVLLGARPTEPEAEYGWIEPGDIVGETTGSPLHRIRRFWEKPTDEDARACYQAGHLWNTFVMIAPVARLVDVGRQFVPVLHHRLSRIAPFAGTEDEPWAIHQAYALAPTANFSESILQACPPNLAVSQLPPLTWCDLGTPRRVLAVLERLGISPPWRRAVHRPA